MLDGSSYLVGLRICWLELTHPIVNDCTRAWECWDGNSNRSSFGCCCCPSTSMLDRSSYREKFSIRRPEFTCPMVDDRTRAWECWTACCNGMPLPLLLVDQHSHVGSQFIPGGAQHSLAAMHASYCERLHSSIGVLGWQWQPEQLRLLLLPQHFHAGSQFIPGGAQHLLAVIHASYGGRLHSSTGVLGQHHRKK
jgi:hypothetical protein